jgi:luciferase family oxidoreductase group 1
MSADSADTFPNDVQELQAYFEPAEAGQRVRAIPGEGLEVPIWLLGSSLYSAQLAAFLGLPFAFASHFAPEYLLQALEVYRREFRPSRDLQEPYAMVAANVVVADTDKEAEYAFTSAQLGVLNMLRGKRTKMPQPVDDIDSLWSEAEREGVDRFLKYAFVGSPFTVQSGLERFLEETQADELIVTARIYDPAVRLRSFELLTQVRERMREACAVVAG